MIRERLLAVADHALTGARTPAEAFVLRRHTLGAGFDEGLLRAHDDVSGGVALRVTSRRGLGTGTALLSDPAEAMTVARAVRTPVPRRMPLARAGRADGRVPPPPPPEALDTLVESVGALDPPRGIQITGAGAAADHAAWALATTTGFAGVAGMVRWYGHVGVRTGHASPGTGSASAVATRDPPELQPLLDEAAAIARATAAPKRSPARGRGSVLLAPEVVEEFLATLLLPALSRARIKRNESPLGPPGTPLETDLTIKDLGPRGPFLGTFDDEGSPILARPLVANGEVRADLATRLDAARHGGRPTGGVREGRAASTALAALPRNLAVTGPPRMSWDDAQHEADIVVHEVLGMHTADRSTGRFSLELAGAHTGGPNPRGVRDLILVGTLRDLLRCVTARAGPDRILAAEPMGVALPGLLVEGLELVDRSG